MPNPTLTWEQSTTTILTTPGDNVEAMAALAALITASSDWVVEDGGDGVTDDYLEIAGDPGGPNPNARIFVGANPTAGANKPHPDNMGFEHVAGGVNDDWWVAFSVNNGRTANPWASSLPLYAVSSRWSGLMMCGTNAAANPMDRIKIWSNEEQLVVIFGYSNISWEGFMAGALVVPTREADGEADGRVRGLWCQYGILPSNFWVGSSPPFNNTSTSQNATAKAMLFDPNELGAGTPQIMKALTSLAFTSTNQTNVAGDDAGEVHRAPVVISDTVTSPTGNNVPNLSPRAGAVTGHVVFGVLRQIRQGPDRVSDLAITDPPPPINVVSYTLGQSATIAQDTLYFDNV